MLANHRMTFGVFMAPFHRVGENPTVSLARDLELLQWLDLLDFDEAWIGEHHSAGWETIASPELMIAAAAERTRHIMLGTGVVSIPYHHPFNVAERMVQLDHMTRGRAMLGVGPGALSSDARMLGIDPLDQRRRMEEGLDAIIQLLTSPEPVTWETDWFTLRDARLHLRPYTRPHFPIAVASTLSPSGMRLAGKHGVGVLSIGSFLPTGLIGLPDQWRNYEEAAEQAGKPVDRARWRLLLPVYLAEDREQAFDEARAGFLSWAVEYFDQTLGRPMLFPGDDPLKAMVEGGGALVGTPADAVEKIKRLGELSGGFGGLLCLVHEWAPREKLLHSYELLARYVMPYFQDANTSTLQSQRWVSDNKAEIFGSMPQVMERAFADAGQKLPEGLIPTAAPAHPAAPGIGTRTAAGGAG